MPQRVLSLFLFGALLAIFLGTPLVAQEKAGKNIHEGKFVSAKGDEFTMEDKAGKEHKHTLAPDGKVFALDGKQCKLNDLKRGDHIRVTTKEGDVKTATKIEALKPS
jgi:hypothetical protein